MTEHSSYPVPGSVHRDWLDKGGLSPRIMRYIEHVEGEAAALRADLEQTTDERNALLHARTALRAECEEFADEAEKDAAEILALRAERDALNEEANALSREATRLAAELERVTTERDDAYALIRHYADTDPEVALAERMRPVVEAAKACADCDCESPRHDDDGNLFLPKGGYPCAWDCPHLEGLLDAVEACRVATSEQETVDGSHLLSGGRHESHDAVHRRMAEQRKTSEQEASDA